MTSQMQAAVLAVKRVRVVALGCAGGARLPRNFSLSCRLREFNGDDAGGNRDNAVAGNHHYRRQHLAQRRARREVAVTDSRQRHDGPIDAERDACETVLFAFYDVHERAYDDDEQDYGGEKDADLAPART